MREDILKNEANEPVNGAPPTTLGYQKITLSP